jgi:AmmeMemoRadiSam system protein B
MDAMGQIVRPPAMAGSFYPAEPQHLRAAVAGYLAAARPWSGPPPRAIITPHAGYPYSGPIAGTAWAAARTARPRRILLLGPAHRVWVPDLAHAEADAWATPLGLLPVDRAALAGLPGSAAAHAREHCLEVQLPFIQVLWPGMTVLPLLVGGATAQRVAEVIAGLWDDSTLLAISTDLSHYLPYAQAQASDRACAAAITALDAEAIRDEQACGHRPLAGLLITARARGLAAQVLDLRNSGDTAGPRDQVVGYAAAVVASS